MIDLQASVPTVFWTYGSVSEHQYWCGGDEEIIWIADTIRQDEW